MKEIKVCTGQTVLVDDEDAEIMERFKWRVSPNGYVYATVYLHRLLRKAPRTLVVDHEDRNRLNNCKSNLVPKTQSQNCRNRNHQKKKRSSATSKYFGVSLFKGRWRATITHAGKQHYFGVFDEETAAAAAYNSGALKLLGVVARLNVL